MKKPAAPGTSMWTQTGLNNHPFSLQHQFSSDTLEDSDGNYGKDWIKERSCLSWAEENTSCLLITSNTCQHVNRFLHNTVKTALSSSSTQPCSQVVPTSSHRYHPAALPSALLEPHLLSPCLTRGLLLQFTLQLTPRNLQNQGEKVKLRQSSKTKKEAPPRGKRGYKHQVDIKNSWELLFPITW